MIWQRIDQYHLKSDAGHTICKFWINGEQFYELHEGKRLVATRLGSADIAKALVHNEKPENGR